MIGELNRVYEVLSRKRSLTLPMIRRLAVWVLNEAAIGLLGLGGYQ
jgi:antitoxin component HigA of HigAB toxin-antitoxin module